MQYRQKERKLFLKVEQNLNWVTARRIERAAMEVDEVYLDLSDARIVDSEGVILLYHLLEAGKIVRIKEAPIILSEIVNALDLQEVIPLDILTDKSFEV